MILQAFGINAHYPTNWISIFWGTLCSWLYVFANSLQLKIWDPFERGERGPIKQAVKTVHDTNLDLFHFFHLFLLSSWSALTNMYHGCIYRSTFHMLHSGCDYLNSPFLNITQVSPFMRGSLLKVEWMGMHKEKGQGVEEYFFFLTGD